MFEMQAEWGNHSALPLQGPVLVELRRTGFVSCRTDLTVIRVRFGQPSQPRFVGKRDRLVEEIERNKDRDIHFSLVKPSSTFPSFT